MARSAFQAHSTTFVIINTMLVAIWAITSFGGYFWPVWPILGWGVAVAFHAWATYGRPRH